MDQYSQRLVFNADQAIRAVELGDRRTALLVLRHVRNMLATGLPTIISLALENSGHPARRSESQDSSAVQSQPTVM